MTRGKLVLVPFPFDDFVTTKVRPALCLTDPIGPHRHIVIAFITSRVPVEVLETDMLIDAKHSDFTATGLRVSSTVQLHRLMTIATSMIQRELGSLSPLLLNEAGDKLKNLFGLRTPA